MEEDNSLHEAGEKRKWWGLGLGQGGGDSFWKQKEKEGLILL